MNYVQCNDRVATHVKLKLEKDRAERLCINNNKVYAIKTSKDRETFGEQYILNDIGHVFYGFFMGSNATWLHKAN